MNNSFVEGKKALEALLYITNHGVNDVWKTLKLIFYAEKIHMERYGQPISGDTFIAMDAGPVPSFSYDLIKSARGKSWCNDEKVESLDSKSALRTEGTIQVFPKRKANLDLLSESAIEALDEALKTYGSIPDPELSRIAHSESCYVSTRRDAPIAVNDYLEWLDLSPEMRKYIYS